VTSGSGLAVFDAVADKAMSAYDKMVSLDPSEAALDSFQHKALWRRRKEEQTERPGQNGRAARMGQTRRGSPEARIGQDTSRFTPVALRAHRVPQHPAQRRPTATALHPGRRRGTRDPQAQRGKLLPEPPGAAPAHRTSPVRRDHRSLRPGVSTRKVDDLVKAVRVASHRLSTPGHPMIDDYHYPPRPPGALGRQPKATNDPSSTVPGHAAAGLGR